MYAWIRDNWPKATIFLVIYLTIPLFLFVLELNPALFLIWIQLPVYFLHEFEEYVYPGGFLAFFNTKILKSPREEGPLDLDASFWINIPLIFVGFLVCAILATVCKDPNIGLWIAYFSAINALAHVGWVFKFKYNPGFWVSLLVNIPVGIYTVCYFAEHAIASTETQIISLVIGVVVQVVMAVYGFVFLKPKIKTYT
jgi:hypothetical protein